jgi:hypothetical protein
MKVLGKHVQSSGLHEAWVEKKNLLGRKAAEKMSGKLFDKGMRSHDNNFSGFVGDSTFPVPAFHGRQKS